MPDIVILEGPDGGGKTSMKSRLLTEINLEERPRACTSEGGPVDELFKWLENDVLQLHMWDLVVSTANPGLLYDRYPPFSELAYGPCCRRTISPGFTGPKYVAILRELRRLNPIVIWCLPPLDVVMTNVHNDDMPQMPGVRENIEVIYYTYLHLRSWWAALDGRSMLWDYSNHYGGWPAFRHDLLEMTALSRRKG